jgi:hypothetical protein
LLRATVAQMDRRSVHAILLLLAFLLFTVPSFFRSWNAVDRSQPPWASAAFWVKSAKCARTTGAILVLCEEGRLLSIADRAARDDLGLPLTLGLYSAVTGAAVTETDIAKVNTTLNYVGIAALGALLFCLRLPFLSFLILTVGASIANQNPLLWPHPGHFGVACLVTILPLAILGIPLMRPSRGALWFWIVLGLVDLAVAMLFRESIGLMGVVAGFFALSASYCLSIIKMRHAALVHILITCAIVLSIWTPYFIFRARDVSYHIAPSDQMEQHGAWHNLYIGLGVVDNPFGITWDDNNGIEAVKKVDPKVKYLSAEYYSILRHEYFGIVLHHPRIVGAIYLEKLKIALRSYSMSLILIVVAVVFACTRWRLAGISSAWTTSDAVFAVSAIFVVMFLGQAALFHYAEQYLFPVRIFLILLSGVLFELLRTLGSAAKSDQFYAMRVGPD